MSEICGKQREYQFPHCSSVSTSAVRVANQLCTEAGSGFPQDLVFMINFTSIPHCPIFHGVVISKNMAAILQKEKRKQNASNFQTTKQLLPTPCKQREKQTKGSWWYARVVKAFAVKAGNLSSIPGMRMVKEQNLLPPAGCPLTSTCTCT